jgi:hypothetical protein
MMGCSRSHNQALALWEERQMDDDRRIYGNPYESSDRQYYIRLNATFWNWALTLFHDLLRIKAEIRVRKKMYLAVRIPFSQYRPQWDRRGVSERIYLTYPFDLPDFLRIKLAVINPTKNPSVKVERRSSTRGIVIVVKRNFVSTCCLFWRETTKANNKIRIIKIILTFFILYHLILLAGRCVIYLLFFIFTAIELNVFLLTANAQTSLDNPST